MKFDELKQKLVEVKDQLRAVELACCKNGYSPEEDGPLAEWLGDTLPLRGAWNDPEVEIERRAVEYEDDHGLVCVRAVDCPVNGCRHHDPHKWDSDCYLAALAPVTCVRIDLDGRMTGKCAPTGLKIEIDNAACKFHEVKGPMPEVPEIMLPANVDVHPSARASGEIAISAVASAKHHPPAPAEPTVICGYILSACVAEGCVHARPHSARADCRLPTCAHGPAQCKSTDIVLAKCPTCGSRLRFSAEDLAKMLIVVHRYLDVIMGHIETCIPIVTAWWEKLPADVREAVSREYNREEKERKP